VWITELRPRWYASWWQAQSRCDGSQTGPTPKVPEPCLLLARLDVPIVPAALLGPRRWVVPSASGVTVDERQRPILVPLRMLQEWLWCGWPEQGGAGAAVVAGGAVIVDQPPSGPYRLEAVDEGGGVVRIHFDPFLYPARSYAITALARGDTAIVSNPRVEYDSTVAQGIRLRVKSNTNPPGALAGLQLMVQITQLA
jgi:hypothetical protein